MGWKCKQRFPPGKYFIKLTGAFELPWVGDLIGYLCVILIERPNLKMDSRLYQDCCLQLILQFSTPWKYLQQNLAIFLLHSIMEKSIWVLFIANLQLRGCLSHRINKKKKSNRKKKKTWQFSTLCCRALCLGFYSTMSCHPQWLSWPCLYSRI